MLDEVLGDIVDLSKLRCQSDFGLKRDASVRLGRLTDYEVNEHRQSIAHILGRNAGAFGKLRALAKDAGYCMLITDANCVVVEEFSDTSGAEQLSRQGLKCGTVWQEQRAGTNGMGLCATTGQVLTVAGQDHFFKAFEQFACTAAPILGEEGEVLGVVNLTGVDNRSDANAGFVRHVLAETAAEIQADIFRHNNQSKLLVQVREGSVSHPNALIALSDDGTIASITPSAAKVISGSATSADARGRMITDFLHAEISDLLPSIGRTQYVELTNKGTCFATPLVLPKTWQASMLKSSQSNSRRSASGGAQRKLSEGDADLSRLIGSDVKMRRTLDLSERMLESGIPVVLVGEAGTGKISFARALHAIAPHPDEHPTIINCPLVQHDDLVKEVSSFLGADAPADGDQIMSRRVKTLILREIGELPPAEQATLFNLLSSNLSADLGLENSAGPRRQIVSTTSINLFDLQEQEKLKPELLHLLKGASLAIPALRDRTDLEVIVNDRLAKLSDQKETLSPAAREALLGYAWPGNLLEMTNAMRYALACRREGEQIALEDLPQEICIAPVSPERVKTESLPPVRLAATQTLTESRADAERQRIMQALLATGWNVSDAANTIGVSRATVHRKIKEFGIERPSSKRV